MAAKVKKKNVCAVDLFCGAGGLTHGLEKAGIDVRLGIDIDPACQFPYEANNKAKFLLKSVKDIESIELAKVFRKGSVKLLAGCAPCQTFSTYFPKANPSDQRWWLLLHFLRLIKDLSPELVTMENVPGLIKQSIFNDFVGDLENEGYSVSFQIVKCAEYGIPQNRQRLVLLASKLGAIDLLPPNGASDGATSVREAIGKMLQLNAGEASPFDPLHQSASLSDLNLRRIKASKPGGTWREWDDDLIANCHKRKTGKTYPSVYGRMCWDEPAPAMTTQFYGFGNGRFGHPEQDRAISLREGAILQTFPEKYSFVPPGEEVSFKAIGRLIGNAVPVKLAEIIGKSIKKHVAIHLKNSSSVHVGAKIEQSRPNSQ
jgi:DNA (cytosine-5)-methyltransferase 1